MNPLAKLDYPTACRKVVDDLIESSYELDCCLEKFSKISRSSLLPLKDFLNVSIERLIYATLQASQRHNHPFTLHSFAHAEYFSDLQTRIHTVFGQHIREVTEGRNLDRFRPAITRDDILNTNDRAIKTQRNYDWFKQNYTHAIALEKFSPAYAVQKKAIQSVVGDLRGAVYEQFWVEESAVIDVGPVRQDWQRGETPVSERMRGIIDKAPQYMKLNLC